MTLGVLPTWSFRSACNETFVQRQPVALLEEIEVPVAWSEPMLAFAKRIRLSPKESYSWHVHMRALLPLTVVVKKLRLLHATFILTFTCCRFCG